MFLDFVALVGCMGAAVIHAEEDQERAGHDMALYREHAEKSSARLFGAASPVKPRRKTWDCVGCGAPLFGVMNENCQYCRRQSGQE